MPSFPTSREEPIRLPLRGIVLFAERCAQRVKPLFTLPARAPNRAAHLAAIERSLGTVAWFTSCEHPQADGYVSDLMEDAQQASNAIAAIQLADFPKPQQKIAALNAGRATLTACHAAERAAYGGDRGGRAAAAFAADAAKFAVAAAEAMGTNLRPNIRLDFDLLYAMDLGRFPNLGEPIDREELHPLWSDTDRPSWFTNYSL